MPAIPHYLNFRRIVTSERIILSGWYSYESHTFLDDGKKCHANLPKVDFILFHAGDTAPHVETCHHHVTWKLEAIYD